MASNPNEQLAIRTINQLAKKYNFESEEVREMLKEKFGTFNPSKIPEFDTYIMQMDLKRQDEIEQEEIESKMNPVPLPPCPICGADTFGDPSLYGKLTKTEGWQCTVGGKKHYYQWRTNRIVRRKGLPLIYQEKGVQDEHQ